MHGFILTQVQGFGFPFAEINGICVVPFFQPIKVSCLLLDADIPVEALLVALHVPHQIQFHVVIHFSNPIPAQKKPPQNSLSKMPLRKSLDGWPSERIILHFVVSVSHLY